MDDSPRDEEPSQVSSARSQPLRPGMSVKLLRPGVGHVGVGIVIEENPKGQWLGVTIVPAHKEYILLRPSIIKKEAENIPLIPSQRGLNTLLDALQRTILWRVADVTAVSGDLQISDEPFLPQDCWVGLEVHRLNAEGAVVAAGRVHWSLPDEPFRNGELGEGLVGVTVLDVFVGNPESIMSHERWSISECCFPSGRSLLTTIAYFASRPIEEDPESYLGGKRKDPYKFQVRKRSEEKESLYRKRTSDDEIRKLSSERCCPQNCCQHFSQQESLRIRQRLYAKSFEDRREYVIFAGEHLHCSDGDQRRKYLTLLGRSVCSAAWYKIHGISKSTFFRNIEKYLDGVVNAHHANKGIKRPRIGTLHALGSITTIVNENADQMPHQMRGIGHGRKDTLKYLPVGHNWKQVLADANETNVSYGLRPISQSPLSRLKKENFNNVKVKPVGSYFAKCTVCDQLQNFISKSPKGSAEYVEYVKQRTQHLAHQKSCRRLYGSWREESKRNPQQLLCIIHDKMDTAKTALPRMRTITKATQGLGQLPMSVTGMVAHGHGDGAYAHYAPALWPGDLNATISSLARLLRRLEGPPLRESGALFEHPPPNTLFEILMRGKSRCLQALKPVDPASAVGSVPLPPNLYLQLDNSAKDNKNQYLMAFLSLLTARGVFKEIQVGFLVVGHTHEDIDGYFSHMSSSLKMKNTFVLADLMMTFMQSQVLSFMPELIQEVADFKSFVKGYLNDGPERLIGLGEMHLFKFYVDSNDVPLMKYKRSGVDEQWLPHDRAPICLWKLDADGRPRLPDGSPKHVPLKPVWGSEVPKEDGNSEKNREKARKATENKTLITLGLQKYIEYWKNGMSRCEGFASAFGPYVDYWSRMLIELGKPLPETPSELVEGFWPSNDWRAPCREPIHHAGRHSNAAEVTPEDEQLPPYCGPKNEAPQPRFNPWRDIHEGSWVLMRPEDPRVCPVWQGRAASTVCREEGHENQGKFLIQYWEPRNAERNLRKKYLNRWEGQWVKEKRSPEWVSVDCVLFASWSKIADPKTRTIPQAMKETALQNLRKANEADP